MIPNGERRVFYSTARAMAAQDGTLLRSLTGQKVQIISARPKDEDEDEQVYEVRCGFTSFDAFEGELDGHYYRTAQYYAGVPR